MATFPTPDAGLNTNGTASASPVRLAIAYTAEPTPVRFHQSNATIRGIMGCVGSGKSVACCMEILARSMQQKVGKDGVRRTRWAVIRNTYGELASTTVKTWAEWIPESYCPLVHTPPIHGAMRVPLPDGTRMDMEVWFIALDTPRDVRKLKSLEITGAWVNEASEISWNVIDWLRRRVGRYPGKESCDGLTWYGIIMDTNPPDNDHWWYRLAEEEKPSGWKFFRQPGALLPVRDASGRITGFKANPLAENVQHQQLGYAYWMNQVAGADPQRTLTLCCGEYGSVFDGKPVYQGIFNDAVHVATKPLGVYRGLPLFAFCDYGLTPACAISQITPTGQLRILRELQCERGGLKQFLDDAVKPMLISLFPEMAVVMSGDPAGEAKSQPDETTCVDILEKAGFTYTPVPTNKFVLRRQAVIDRLVRMAGDAPAFVIDPSCKILRKGFLGGYRFERVQVTGEERYKDEPVKNRFSHLQDCIQGLCLLVDSVHTRENLAVPPAPVPTWAGL